MAVAIGVGVAVVALSALAWFSVRTGTPEPGAAVDANASSSPAPTLSSVAVASPTASTPARTSWDDVLPSDYPAYVADQDPREPRARVLEPWIWDHVGPGWSLAVWNAFGASEQGLGAQALFLIAPNGEIFRHSTLRHDIGIGVVAWSSSERVAWLNREGGCESCGDLVEYDLATTSVRVIGDELGGDANRGGMGFVAEPVIGSWTDGKTQVWMDSGPDDNNPGFHDLYFRDPVSRVWRTSAFAPTVIDYVPPALRGKPAEVEGGWFGSATGWVDGEQRIAVWLATVTYATLPWTTNGVLPPEADSWWIHDLDTDNYVLATPLYPQSDAVCYPASNVPAMLPDWVVVECYRWSGQTSTADRIELGRFTMYLDGTRRAAAYTGPEESPDVGISVMELTPEWMNDLPHPYPIVPTGVDWHSIWTIPAVF